MNNVPIMMRPYMPEDQAFLFNSWLKSFRNGTVCNNVDNSVYYTNQHIVIERLLQTSKVIVCCNSEDPRIIYGYCVYEHIQGQFVLHYIYVKNIYRKLGLARKLLEETKHDFSVLGCYTHQTVIGDRNDEKFNLIYHPYILMNTVK
jgi:ribosomal protein S18 acetylase RimI-like enzyme